MQKQHPPRHLVLASGSAYRAALLRRLNLEFEIITADIDERPGRGETGRALAQRLAAAKALARSEEHTSELQSRGHLVCRLLLEKYKSQTKESTWRAC